MSSTKIAHSKFKNTGILFELLVRQITADTLEGKLDSPALKVLQEFFKPSSELGKEMSLYRAFFESSKLSETRAFSLVEMIVEQRRKLDQRKLNEQKYQLVRKIKELYPLKEFLSAKIPKYKVYASIYKTFLSESMPASIDIGDIGEIANARFTIVEHLTGENEKKDEESHDMLIESFKKQAEDIRLLSYKILVDRFNDKYETCDEKQKELLREYINNVSGTNSLREYINIEIPKIKDEIQKRVSFIRDKVTQIKLNEVVSQLSSLSKGKNVTDSQVTAIMISYQLIREMDECLSMV